MNALTILLAVLGFLATGTGAVAAVGSWRSSRNSDRAATTLAEIERNRWHSELTPQFDITCYRSADSPAATLRVTLTGPDGLDRVDSVEVTIRNNRRLVPTPIANGPSLEDLAAVIWGPLRFVPGVNGADRLGRAVPAFPIDRQETVLRAMEESFPPHWNSDPSAWRRDHAPTRSGWPSPARARAISPGRSPAMFRSNSNPTAHHSLSRYPRRRSPSNRATEGTLTAWKLTKKAGGPLERSTHLGYSV